MRPVAIMDIEVYVNYFLVAFKDVATGRVATFEQPLDTGMLRKILMRYRIVTFNGTNYDIPILMYALSGASEAWIKGASNRIITHNLKPWTFASEFNVRVDDPIIDHVDLMEVAPLVGSLKLYGGRLHSKFIQNLPIPHETTLTQEQKDEIKAYCLNDLHTTQDLYNALRVQLDLRQRMSAQYGIDLLSKSDAQIAEAVVKSEIEHIQGRRIEKPGVQIGTRFSYTIPTWMTFSTLDILDDIRKAEFLVNDKGSVLMPPELSHKKISLDGNVYRMGIGGLHSSEKAISHIVDKDHVLIDRDVTSYYPSIVLNQKLCPSHIGPVFTRVYQGLVDARLAAKRNGDKAISESLKICINGLFGKLGSRYSIVYSPELLVQVTLTGQLALLMLIEMITTDGIHVVSANTDGVFVRCHKARVDEFNARVLAWESVTGFKTEEERYASLHSRDVNNYIAVKEDGHKTKLKGCYGVGLPLHKNPTTAICAEAVVDWLTLGADVEASVRYCQDIRKFVTIRNVTGGAVWRGQELGKTIRWYYAKGEKEAILYSANTHLVPRTYGAKPLMVLPDTLPEDIDYDWYVKEANEMIVDIGAAPL